MAIDKSAADVATSSLKSLPFGNIIGGPLVACVEAQAQAARTSWEFIKMWVCTRKEKRRRR